MIGAPFALSFATGNAQAVMIALGIAIIIMALLTDYEASAVRLIPMPVHLGIDVLAGIFLTMSPWLFGFAEFVYVPHVAFGLFIIVVSSLTASRPSYSVLQSQRDPVPHRELRR